MCAPEAGEGRRRRAAPGAAPLDPRGGRRPTLPALVADAVLTHRLAADERAGGSIEIGTDLAGFLRFPDLHVGAGPLLGTQREGRACWHGPTGWLAEFPTGALLGVRVGEDGAVAVSVVDPEPVTTPALVALLREVYDAEVDEPGLPVSAEDLVLGMRHRDRDAFARPGPPLTELAEAAGLERRGHEFAHDESVWAQRVETDRLFRIMAVLPRRPQVLAAMTASGILLADGPDPRELRQALDLLADPQVLVAVTDEMLGDAEDPERVEALRVLADRLVAVAGHPARTGAARWIAAVAAERGGRVLDAESHLRVGVVESLGWPFLGDRLAWYEADRGDAVAALARWRALGAPDSLPDVAFVRRFAATGDPRPEPGRNEACWCGSGRKFKQCHLGKPVVAPLPERVGWLHRKHVAAAGRQRRAGGRSPPGSSGAAAAKSVIDERSFRASTKPKIAAASNPPSRATSWVHATRRGPRTGWARNARASSMPEGGSA